MAKNFWDAVKDRRSYYDIAKEAAVSDERLRELIEHAVKHAPSAFNSQSSRVALLLGEHHHKLWDITKEALRQIVPAAQFDATGEKMDSFRNGYGTVLFFEDQSVVKGLQQQFPAYADNFPVWSEHATGMLQYIIWAGLESEGLGASLQHYSPLIEAAVKREWQIPAEWKLVAQMPFGKPAGLPGAKEFKPLEERVKVFK